MQIGPFTIARTKALSLSGVTGSRGWWPLIQELTTGAWQRNEDVAVDTVLSNPTLFACITLIARDIAKLRLKLMEQDADGIWSETSSAAFSPFLRKPNHYQTRIDFFKWWVTSVLSYGNTYALKARDDRGVVSAAYILDPCRVMPLVAPDTSVFYQLVRDELAGVEHSVVVPAREMFHDKETPLFHPLCGVSPIYAAGYPAIQGLNIRRSSDKFFANGSKPGGVLTSPMNIGQETADRIKAYWDSNFSGNNIGKIAVLGDGLKYEAMAMTAEQSQLIDQLKMSDEDIAKCFAMPRHKVGIGPDPTYANIEPLTRNYYADCLQERIERLELLLDEGLGLTAVPGRTLGVEFERNDLFQMDNESRMRMASEGVRAGVFSPNEVRRQFDMKPVKGGESPMLQQQMFSLEALAERDDEQPFATPAAPTPALPPSSGETPEPPTETPDPPTTEDGDKACVAFRKELAAA